MVQKRLAKVIKNLPHFNCIPLDLPFHGQAKGVEVTNFEETAEYLSQKIKSAVKNEPYFLVGYSLGGRIALYYALQAQVERSNLQGVILEGANLGLKPTKKNRLVSSKILLGRNVLYKNCQKMC